MSYGEPARPTAGGPRASGVAAAAVLAAVAVSLGGFLVERSSARSGDEAGPMPPVTVGPLRPPVAPRRGFAPAPGDGVPRRQQGALDQADGVVAGGVTAFDNEHPAVAELDPILLGALRQAAKDAASEGVELVVESGWRSPKYQDQLLREAIAKHGSAREAARWVATSETSAHVSGDAVDIGPPAAAAWLAKHGAGYGLCPIYRNEPWHYELRADAIDNGCPRLYTDATHDPRMQP